MPNPPLYSNSSHVFGEAFFSESHGLNDNESWFSSKNSESIARFGKGSLKTLRYGRIVPRAPDSNVTCQ
ncbi:hypothetical protein AB1N83_005922 [Pleurotus pulmonarius]